MRESPSNPVPAQWLSARQAAEKLGVSLATLYSYTSRGLLHPISSGGGRGKSYSRAEVERLAQRHAGARNPHRVAATALDFGMPVLESGICLIQEGRYYYRGCDATDLAESAGLEDVAELLSGLQREIWFAAAPSVSRRARAALARHRGLPMPQRMLSSFNALADDWDLTRGAIEPSLEAGLCMQAMVIAASGAIPVPGRPVHEQLQRAWDLRVAAADVLRCALVLCADHELNVSSFTSRCIASTGASPSAAVSAALGALTGPRHGGYLMGVDAGWNQTMQSVESPRQLDYWLRTKAKLAGFGHPLYPLGDPRGRCLLAHLPADEQRERLLAAVHERSGLRPTIDFGLVAMSRAIDAPPGAAFATLAIGRCAGWLAHYFEHRQVGKLIRPRATYTGPSPFQPAAAVKGRLFKAR